MSRHQPQRSQSYSHHISSVDVSVQLTPPKATLNKERSVPEAGRRTSSHRYFLQGTRAARAATRVGRDIWLGVPRWGAPNLLGDPLPPALGRGTAERRGGGSRRSLSPHPRDVWWLGSPWRRCPRPIIGRGSAGSARPRGTPARPSGRREPNPGRV